MRDPELQIGRRGSTSGPLAGFLLTAWLLAPAVAAQPRNLDEWIAVRTDHFVIFTDARPERGAEIAHNLELFRGTFARLAPRLELRSAVPTTFLAFADSEVYAPYKRPPSSSILGQFLIHRDRNFLTLDAGTRAVGAFTVVYHEFVHYLVAHNFAQVPRWFHEGLAEYYSTFAVEGETIHVGRPVERHVRWLGYDNADRRERTLTHDVSLRAVLTGESGHHGRRAGGFYALSWALVHYLLSGGPERLDQMADFLVRLRDREDPDEAFERAFDTRLDDLEETLRAYAWRARKPASGGDAAGFPVATLDLAELGRAPSITVQRLPAPTVLYHLGDLSLRLGRPEAAERHFRTALEHAPRHAESLAGLALLHDLESRFAEADVLYRDALEIGSGDPLTYVRYGRHLLARILPRAGAELVAAGKLTVAGKLAADGELTRDERLAEAERLAAAARQAFAAAIEVDGEFAEARALFGYAHLFGEVDPAPGIRALEKARAWLPDRDDLTLFLIQLHLEDKAFSRARALLDGDLREHAGPEAVLWAEEEIERARLLHAASDALAAGDAGEALRLFDQAIAVTSDQDLRDRMAERLRVLQDRHSPHLK